MSVIIKVETGFVGGTHEQDTGLSVEEWQDLSEDKRNDLCDEFLHECCGSHAEDENGNILD